MSNTVDLYERLNRGPAFLLLGQHYLSLETSIDPFLAEVLRKYGSGSTDAEGYHQILGNEASKSTDSKESALAWMQNKCSIFSTPLWLGTVADFAWSGVYTSAIDIIWQRAFKASWREIEPIYTEEKNPLDARSRSKLHCTYLFGSVDQSSSDQRPPLTRLEMNRRRQIAVSLLRRLPSLITPLGSLLIEGYGEDDWMPLDDLLVVIDQMQPGQVHWFHADSQLREHPDVDHLVNSGKITLYEESLATFLKHGEDFLQFGDHTDVDVEGHLVGIAGKNRAVPISLWNQINRSATVVDAAAGSDLLDISEEKRYMDFRSFLARSGTKPIWSAYARGFSFRRDFEQELLERVLKQLESPELSEDPIILHGQSGIGKTVALGSLAYRVKSEGIYPVLFIERRPLRPSHYDMDAFLEWAENQGASNTLVVWDGMLEFDQYLETIEYLTSRGRRLVLVGSSYRYVDSGRIKGREDFFVDADPILSPREMQRFGPFLKGLLPNIGGIENILQKYGANFFVSLYRILPTTRRQLSAGINLEASYSEERIDEIAKELASEPANVSSMSSMAYALMQAGFEAKPSGFSTDAMELAGEYMDQINQLTGLVMVPGRFGLRVPVELLMRTIGYDVPVDIIDILSKVDLFSWDNDSAGNITIGPRHSLEAELITRTRLGGPRYEIEFTATLLRHIAPTDTEIQFAIDLIRKFNPSDGDRHTNPYTPYLLVVTDALEYVREQRSLLNPRLMLQESNLLRESIRASEITDDSISYDDLLDRAENVISRALELVDQQGMNRELRSQLLVELAATLGSRAKHLYDTDPQNAERLYLNLRQFLFDARTTSRSNFYPIDVLFWTTRDLVRAENVSAHVRLDAQAEILNTFEMAELDESFTALQRFHERKQELGYLVGNYELSDDAFAELERQGSTAGYVLKAMQMVGELPRDRILDQDEISRVSNALRFLEKHYGKLSHDGRALQTLFRYWWFSKVHHPIFWGERQSLPFNVDDWTYCFKLLSEILGGEEVYRSPILKYLLGITLFHLGTIDQAEQVFEELGRENPIRGPRRIMRSYLMSTSDGEPKKFSGTVEWISSDKRGAIYIPELRKTIPFRPSDFRQPDIIKGSALNDFHIAFNFIGFLADPPGFLVYSERRNRS